ncbi:hypothetical protein Q1695_003737 [Nippostrongylus brasiliensis]|nr:hypothetical protein Q1695_003737 [Nippostrongylus brasiliensis]
MEGLTRNGREDSFPPGKNMYMLEWDCNLEHLAEWRLTSDCTLNATELVYNAESAVVVDHGSRYGDVDAMLNAIVDAGSKLHMTFEISITSPEAVSYVGSEALQPFVNMIQGKAARIGCSGKICAANPLSMPYGLVSCIYNVPIGRESWYGDVDVMLNEIVYSSKKLYNEYSIRTTNPDSVTYVGSPALQPFVNMIQGKAARIGCSGRICSNSPSNYGMVSCIYNVEPVEPNDVIYERTNWPICTESLNCKSDVITIRGRSEILAKINKLRASVVDGVISNGGTGNFPTGKNMYKLEWDCNLERIAESRLSRNCELNRTAQIYHAESATVVGRENWYGDVDALLNEIIYSSRKLHNELYIRITNPEAVTYVGSPASQPFVNMIQGRAARIGCSGRICADSLSYYGMVSCIYNVPPVLENDVIYDRTAWPICTKDTRSTVCTTYLNSRCDKDSNLIFVHSLSASTDCASNSFSKAFRDTALGMHNNFRSLVATGRVRNGRYGNFEQAPPAQLMYLMEYNCWAEAYAYAHVKHCSKKGSNGRKRPGWKENIHVLETTKTDILGALQNAIATWQFEMTRRGLPSNVIYNRAVYDDPPWNNARKVSKMIWATNRWVGCATMRCHGFFMTSCLYSNIVNRRHAKIYPIGAVCSACPHGNCDKSVGLCA